MNPQIVESTHDSPLYRSPYLRIREIHLYRPPYGQIILHGNQFRYILQGVQLIKPVLQFRNLAVQYVVMDYLDIPSPSQFPHNPYDIQPNPVLIDCFPVVQADVRPQGIDPIGNQFQLVIEQALLGSQKIDIILLVDELQQTNLTS